MPGSVANIITKLGILIGGNDASATNPVPVRGSSGSALIDLATDVVAQAIRDRLPSALVSSRLDVNVGAIAAALAAGTNVIGGVRTNDSTPSGQTWTTAIGAPLTLAAAGTLIVPSGASQYLRQVTILNPKGGAALFYFLYHGAAPTWAGSLTIADNTLITHGQIGTNNQANVFADINGGLYTPNGVTLVVSNTNGANANYGTPAAAVWATTRYGS